MFRRVALLLILLISSLEAWAQVSFTVDASSITALGQPFRVEFTVDAEPDKDSFRAPSFEGFEVIAGPSVSTGRSVQFINGRQSSSYSCSYTYVLLPERAGIFTIGTAQVSVDGKSYKTKELPIEVIAEKGSDNRGSSSSATSPEGRIAKDDIMLRLKLSTTELYKSEPVRASLVLYTRVGVDIESLTMPSFDGFWSQELSFENAPSREEYNGRIYETYKISEYLLWPQQSGRIVIPAAEMSVLAQVVVQDNRSRDPIFGGRQVYHVKRDLKSAPVALNVKEFPKGAPSTFRGAVGHFTMTAQMPTAEVDANSADRMIVTIAGDGNLKFITAPTLKFPDSFELYDTKVADNIKVTAAGMSGAITYTYPFVARSEGDFTIPAVLFTYFDPTSESYETLSTESFDLRVKSDGSAMTPISVENNYMGYGGAMRQLASDIRFIHTDALPRPERGAMLFGPIYWLVIVLSSAIFIVLYTLLRRRIRANRNVVARRMKRADKVAVQRLRMAERYMREDNRHAFYEEMLRAMWGYISDKFNIPVANLTKETIRERLYAAGVSTADAELFCEIISRSDEAQYAPMTEGDMGAVYGDAVEIISKIEDVIKR